ncbi:hypothetical protein P5X00_36950 [Paraburkholderia sp. A2RO-4L]|uniref:hypothetical protein n=1 Tax=Paraburkholderia sp. A2RO-4L TaxID=3028374 RepID=UPI003DA81490
MAKLKFANSTVGNTKTEGFVNFVSEDGKRLSIGTGSYLVKGKDAAGNDTEQRVFKGSVTVFLDDKFDGTVPKLKDYVEISGDRVSTPRQNNDGLVYNDKGEVEMNHTHNVRFANQLVVKEAPKRKDAPATSPAAGSDDDI